MGHSPISQKGCIKYYQIIIHDNPCNFVVLSQKGIRPRTAQSFNSTRRVTRSAERASLARKKPNPCTSFALKKTRSWNMDRAPTCLFHQTNMIGLASSPTARHVASQLWDQEEESQNATRSALLRLCFGGFALTRVPLHNSV